MGKHSAHDTELDHYVEIIVLDTIGIVMAAAHVTISGENHGPEKPGFPLIDRRGKIVGYLQVAEVVGSDPSLPNQPLSEEEEKRHGTSKNQHC